MLGIRGGGLCLRAGRRLGAPSAGGVEERTSPLPALLDGRDRAPRLFGRAFSPRAPASSAGSPFAAGRPGSVFSRSCGARLAWRTRRGSESAVGEVPGRRSGSGCPGTLPGPGPHPAARAATSVAVARQPVPPVAALRGGAHAVSVPAGQRVRRGPVVARGVARAAGWCPVPSDRSRAVQGSAPLSAGHRSAGPATARPRPCRRRDPRPPRRAAAAAPLLAGRPGAAVPGDGGEAAPCRPGPRACRSAARRRPGPSRPAGSSPRRRPGCSG